jgi:hypothetical protein
MNRPQKFERRDPFPRLPFACEEEEGLPTLNDALIVILVVAFFTVVFSF